MAKEKTVKLAVNHPKRYLRVDGKLQLVPLGTVVEATKAQAEAGLANGKLRDPKAAEVVNLTGEEATAGEVESLRADNAALQKEIVRLTAAAKK